MELTRYVQEMQDNLVSTSELIAGGSASPVGQALLTSYADASRMVLLSALSDAIATVNTALDGARVEVRLRGREPEFVVVQSPDESNPELAVCLSESCSTSDAQGQAHLQDFDARLTLRMPGDLKARISQRANMRSVSMNTLLIQIVSKNV